MEQTETMAAIIVAHYGGRRGALPGTGRRMSSVPGVVSGIYLCSSAAGRPVAVDEALAVPGRGLEGDRYFLGCGTWSYERRLWSELTLLESEALEASGLCIEAGEARRNLVTAGIELDSLIGGRFRIGGVEAFGERTCDPCQHLDRLTGQGARAALAGRGGLRARILTRGVLRVGDAVLARSEGVAIGELARTRRL